MERVLTRWRRRDEIQSLERRRKDWSLSVLAVRRREEVS
jgi:hypothetical protein